MNKFTLLLLIAIASFGCDNPQEVSSISTNNWTARKAALPLGGTLQEGTTYLSVYSQIYSQDEHRKHNLTATVSLRNTNLNDSVYIDHAVYYNTEGEAIRTYFDQTIFIRPMETVEIVIDEIDQAGGTGANFLFDWKAPARAHPPFFEAVMISTAGQQGLSFTTQGKPLQ